jgi:hypothetical protein
MAPNRLRFTTLTYPNLQENDLLAFFYFTAITLRGVATVKNPTITVGVNEMPFIHTSLTLIINDDMGNVVQQTTKEVVINSGSAQATIDTAPNDPSENEMENVNTTSFIVEVPAPGVYTYHIIEKGYYNLVNKEDGRIYNVNTSSTYEFEMREDIFYL